MQPARLRLAFLSAALITVVAAVLAAVLDAVPASAAKVPAAGTAERTYQHRSHSNSYAQHSLYGAKSIPMTVNMQFGEIQELEAAFPANVLFKFGGSEDADVFLGSPVMSRALNRMLDAIQAYWLASGNSRRAEGWRDLYVLSKAKHHVGLIASYAPRHPKWASMTRREQLDWLQVIASPHRVDDAGAVFFEQILAN